MTLSTTRINQYGRRLYEKMLSGDRLSPDVCADAYEMFVRRMRRYRDRHPDNKKVSPRFVKQCERWINANLLISKKPKARSYVRLFLLSRAFHLSPGRVGLFAPLVDVKKSEFVRQVKLVKTHLAGKIAPRMQKDLAAAGYWHARSLRLDLEAAEACGRNRAALNTEKKACLTRQRQALRRINQLKTVPSVSDLARIAGASVEQVRHACRVCEAEMKKYFS